MNSSLLVLLAIDLLGPFEAEFRTAAPEACAGVHLEIDRGLQAPVGRNVAWVSALSADELEVVLHTSKVAGDLRRVLRFTTTDTARQRARAAAFTLAAMVRERDADLAPSAREVVIVPAAPPQPLDWSVDVTANAVMAVPGLGGGAGVSARARRSLLPWLAAGGGAQLNVLGGAASTVVQPSAWLDVGLRVDAGAWHPGLFLGPALATSVFLHQGAAIAVWQPCLKIEAEAGWDLAPGHGLRLGLSAQLAPDSATLYAGQSVLGVVGPAWVQAEVGYRHAW